MIRWDPTQEAVLALDPARHARIVGAPGSGKTRVLIEAYARLLERPDWSEGDALVLAPDRLVASRVRGAIERRVRRALGGTPVRTTASLAFALLARAAATAGTAPPRLLTGNVQDEAIASVVSDALASGVESVLAPDVLISPQFRAELREFIRVLDDFDLDHAALRVSLERMRGAAGADAHSDAPSDEWIARWIEGVGIADAVSERLAAERPDELGSSALLRAATHEVSRGAGVPRLLLIDDAQELGEGQLALIAACAAAGSRVWAFGDPDLTTGAFRGERLRILGGVEAEFGRRRAAAHGVAGTAAPLPEPRPAGGDGEQRVVLGRVHRHGEGVREFVRSLTTRIGSSGETAHRAAEAAPIRTSERGDAARRGAPEVDPVRFARAGGAAEQLGVIAHRMRSLRLGLGGGEPLGWGEMAVICRSRGEATRVARALAGHQVPTGVAAGGIVLREHQIVRELIRLLQHALGIAACEPGDVLRLAGGVIGGLDPVAVRRLRGALLLQERRTARAEGREARSIDALVLEAFAVPGTEPVVDSAGGRALRRLARIAAAGVAVRDAGGTPRETLWAVWDATGLSQRWQDAALEGRGVRADEAHRSLDAVLGLFFALQRHEENDSAQPIPDLLEDLLQSAVPEDTLASRSERESVTVTTPQGAIGREFAFVAVVGVQDGSWPNLRSRGSLLGTAALERWLGGGAATPPSRRDTIHDELCLFAHSCARASRELLVVAIADEDHHPGPFFGFGRDHLCTGLPSSRLTLRGATAAMRRRLTRDPGDEVALGSLAALAEAQAAGAGPEEWYGVRAPSSESPLFADDDPDALVPVSPSQLESVEQCPLDWAIAALGGGSGSVQASLGTLVHHALERADGHSAEELLELISAEWGKLPFDAKWESERAKRTAGRMAAGLAAYLAEFDASERSLLGRESGFSIPLATAELRGMADRLERLERPGGTEITVLDLKTGRTPATKAEAEHHVQLQAYQLGVVRGAFRTGTGDQAAGVDPAVSGGARLLYVHPDATKGAAFVERVQQPIDAEAQDALVSRVEAAASVMASGAFTARVEHHCTDPHRPGNCRLHVIQAVSRA